MNTEICDCPNLRLPLLGDFGDRGFQAVQPLVESLRQLEQGAGDFAVFLFELLQFLGLEGVFG